MWSGILGCSSDLTALTWKWIAVKWINLQAERCEQWMILYVMSDSDGWHKETKARGGHVWHIVRCVCDHACNSCITKATDCTLAHVEMLATVFLFLCICVNLTQWPCGSASRSCNAARGRGTGRVRQRGKVQQKEARAGTLAPEVIAIWHWRKRKGAGGQEVIGLLRSAPEMTFPWLQVCDPGWAWGYPLFMLRQRPAD